MIYKKINEEVLYSTEKIVSIRFEDIKRLKEMAAQNTRKRIRLCCHEDIESHLHEMLIVHTRGAYIPPHKHVAKSESFHMIDGQLDIVIFNDDGSIMEVIAMGDAKSGKKFFYRLPKNYAHTVIPLSETVVFHEITSGPFIREDTLFPSWAPDEEETEQVKIYQKKLEDDLEEFLAQPSLRQRVRYV